MANTPSDYDDQSLCVIVVRPPVSVEIVIRGGIGAIARAFAPEKPSEHSPMTRLKLRFESLEDRTTPSNTFTGLGAAASFGVLELNGGSLVLNRADVTGDVGVGPRGSIQAVRSELDGTLFLAPGVGTHFGQNFEPTGGIDRVDLRDAVRDANRASQDFARLAPNLVFGNLTRSLTVQGNGGTSVFRVRSFDFRNDTLTLNGGPSDVFVFNVTGDFSFANSRVVLNGGVTANHVLFNFTSNDADVSVRNADSVVFGTFLAPRGSVEYRDSASFEGAVFAHDIRLHAGATLDNGREAPPSGLASISGIVFHDVDFSGVQDPGEGGLSDVTIHLTGTDDQGNAVDLSTVTDGEGRYVFSDLRPGTYTLTEEQPLDFVTTSNTIGTVDGQANGLLEGDIISAILLAAGNSALGYNFGEVYSGG